MRGRRVDDVLLEAHEAYARDHAEIVFLRATDPMYRLHAAENTTTAATAQMAVVARVNAYFLGDSRDPSLDDRCRCAVARGFWTRLADLQLAVGGAPMIPARVTMLIPSLGRDNEHEVVATVRAIDRALKSAGKDWHALAAALAPVTTQPPVKPDVHRPTAGDQQAPFRSRPKSQRSSWHDLKRSEQSLWVEALISETWLTEAEKDLLLSMRKQLHVGMMVHMSPAQKAALTRLLTKASARGFSAKRYSFGDLARACRDLDRGRLEPHERTFVADMVRRGFGFYPSPKQGEWLASIFERLNARAAA